MPGSLEQEGMLERYLNQSLEELKGLRQEVRDMKLTNEGLAAELRNTVARLADMKDHDKRITLMEGRYETSKYFVATGFTIIGIVLAFLAFLKH